jgi:hypothetical protein
MSSALRLAELLQTEQRQVVGLSRPAGKDDVLQFALHDLGNLLAGKLYRVAGVDAERVGSAAGIAELLTHVMQNDVGHTAINPRRGGEIEVGGH